VKHPLCKLFSVVISCGWWNLHARLAGSLCRTKTKWRTTKTNVPAVLSLITTSILSRMFSGSMCGIMFSMHTFDGHVDTTHEDQTTTVPPLSNNVARTTHSTRAMTMKLNSSIRHLVP
jgi:hypothetical protein